MSIRSEKGSVTSFRPAEDFKKHMDNWIRTFRQAERIDPGNNVLIPGDPEREMTRERLKNGIPVQEAVIEDLQRLAKQFKIIFNPLQHA